MIDATYFRICSDIETRKSMWVAMKNEVQLGVYDPISLASAFQEYYAESVNIPCFE